MTDGGEKRRCTSLTVKGKPCKAWAIAERETCLAHSPKEDREAVGFVPEAGRLGGRPREPKLIDVMVRRVEAAADKVMEAHFRALGVVGWTKEGAPIIDESAAAMEVGRSHLGKVYLTDIADLGARQAAADKLLDRVYGRTRQAVELSGGVEVDGSESLGIPTDAEFHLGVARIIAQAEEGSYSPPPPPSGVPSHAHLAGDPERPTPAALELAEAEGVALDSLIGSGPAGRIVLDDVRKAVAARGD